VSESFVIGDSPDDIRAAVRLGARGCLVRTGWAHDPTVADSVQQEASIVTPSIVEAVQWILSTAVPHPIGARAFDRVSIGLPDER
jgi:ribonucleotide monophosphatase NagD (HAD superfamily)